MKTRILAATILAVAEVLVAAVLIGNQGYSAGKPTIKITTVPPWDPGGEVKTALIAGVVTAPCADCAVQIYSHGDVWYRQPYFATRSVAIGNAKFQARIHLGTEYACFLVRGTYKAANTTI